MLIGLRQIPNKPCLISQICTAPPPPKFLCKLLGLLLGVLLSQPPIFKNKGADNTSVVEAMEMHEAFTYMEPAMS